MTRTTPPATRRHRNDHLVDTPRLHGFGSSDSAPEHRHAVDPLADLDRVIVEKADRVHAQPRIPLHLADDHRAGGAGAGDQHALARSAGRSPPGMDSPMTRIDRRTAATPQAARIQSATRTERENSTMNPNSENRQRHKRRHRHRRGRVGDHQCHHVIDGRVSPEAAVHAEQVEDHHFDCRRGENVGHELRSVREEVPVEAQAERSENSDHEYHQVGEENVSVPHLCAASGWVAASGRREHFGANVLGEALSLFFPGFLGQHEGARFHAEGVTFLGGHPGDLQDAVCNRSRRFLPKQVEHPARTPLRRARCMSRGPAYRRRATPSASKERSIAYRSPASHAN